MRLMLAASSVALVVAVTWAAGLLDPFLAREETETVALVSEAPSLAVLLRERARSGPVPAEPGRVIEPVPREHAELLTPALRGPSLTRFDPVAIYENRPDLRRQKAFREHPTGYFRLATNELGFRDPDPVRPEPPDLRILVTGDSHTFGVVSNEESFANVLEARLRAERPGRSVEVLNAGSGGYALHHYLGVLEKHLALAPDVFVMTVYGGNDFSGSVTTHQYFRRLPPLRGDAAFAEAQARAGRVSLRTFAQGLNQALRFRRFPEELALAMEAARDVVTEAARRCEEEGVRFVCVYLPSPYEVDPSFAADEVAALCELFGDDVDAVRDAIPVPGRQLVTWATGAGIELVDLLEPLRTAEEVPFWRADHHLDLEGHRLVAEALRPLFE